MIHLPQTTQFFNFQARMKFIFSLLYQNEISHQKENFTAIENWNELIPEWLVQKQNVFLVSCKQI